MKESEHGIAKEQASDSLTVALANLTKLGQSDLFWKELDKLEHSSLGQNPQFATGVKLIKKRIWLGREEEDLAGTIAPLYMTEVGENVESGAEAERLQSWVVNHILEQIESETGSESKVK